MLPELREIPDRCRKSISTYRFLENSKFQDHLRYFATLGEKGLLKKETKEQKLAASDSGADNLDLLDEAEDEAEVPRTVFTTGGKGYEYT